MRIQTVTLYAQEGEENDIHFLTRYSIFKIITPVSVVMCLCSSKRVTEQKLGLRRSTHLQSLGDTSMNTSCTLWSIEKIIVSRSRASSFYVWMYIMGDYYGVNMH